MKKRLNLITLLIGVAMCIILGYSETVTSFMEGFRDGMNTADRIKAGENVEVFLLNLEPAVGLAKPLSLLNVKSGELLPARMRSVIVELTTTEKSGWSRVWPYCFTLLFFTGIIMCTFNLVTFIRAVNKSVIFEWINVKRLRRIGVGFLILFVINCLQDFNSYYFLKKSVELVDYKIKNPFNEGGILLFGMIAFLIAEVFAVGLRLREEQELTI